MILFNTIKIPRTENRTLVSGCYLIMDETGRKLYCGVSHDVYGRLQTHRTSLRSYSKFSNGRAIPPGKLNDGWTVEILLESNDRELLILLEDEMHDKYHELLSSSGDGMCNKTHGSDSIDKISKSLRETQDLPWLNKRVINNEKVMKTWELMPEIYKIWKTLDKPKYGKLTSVCEKQFGHKLSYLSRMVNMFEDEKLINRLIIKHKEYFGA